MNEFWQSFLILEWSIVIGCIFAWAFLALTK